jgi:hypothetical protein
MFGDCGDQRPCLAMHSPKTYCSCFHNVHHRPIISKPVIPFIFFQHKWIVSEDCDTIVCYVVSRICIIKFFTNSSKRFQCNAWEWTRSTREYSLVASGEQRPNKQDNFDLIVTSEVGTAIYMRVNLLIILFLCRSK